MYPLLIDLGTHDLPFVGEVHLALPTYGVLFAAGVLLAGFWFIRRGKSLGLPEDHLYNLGFWSLLAGIVGAKLLLVVMDWRSYVEHPFGILGTLRSGGVLLGGVVAGALTFALYASRHDLPKWRLGDAAMAPVALAQAVGRLGCFSAGCCWGDVCERGHPLAVTFTSPQAQAQTGVPLGQPLIAVQLIQAAHDLVLAGVLTWLWRRRPEPPGTIVWTYVLLYSLGRGVIEFWRGDSQRGLWFDGAVSTSQLFALCGIVVAAIALLRSRFGRQDKRYERYEEA